MGCILRGLYDGAIMFGGGGGGGESDKIVCGCCIVQIEFAGVMWRRTLRWHTLPLGALVWSALCKYVISQFATDSFCT